MPENDLGKMQSEAVGGITKAQFNAVIDRAEAIYKPIIAAHGGTLVMHRNWDDSTVNAYAEQNGSNWEVSMFGGLAKRPEVTEDGFAMVLCHEIGHHLGGFPYVQDWAADEGQSDMHATGACAHKVFGQNLMLSEAAASDLPAEVKDKCDAHHASSADRDICYRSIVAGKSLADLLAALGGTGPVNYNTPDTKVVSRTNHQHPAAQCRLDTYMASAYCGNSQWDYTLIPGKSLDHFSKEAEAEAMAHSCVDGDGARPTCWFAPLGDNPTPPADECPLQDPALCAVLCQLEPSQPWCE